MPIGDDFVSVMGIKLLEGRDFSKRLLTDIGTNVLVNEALVRKMGWTTPIGKRLQLGNQSGRVIGVVRRFQFQVAAYADRAVCNAPAERRPGVAYRLSASHSCSGTSC